MKTLLLFPSLIIMTAIAVAQPGDQTVNFTTRDGVVITGTLYASSKASAPTVLCLHQWRSDRSSYAGLATSLRTAGYTVLAIDLRGYGGSTKNSSGKTVRPDREVRPDIEAALKFLRTHKAVNPDRIGIVGASYGSSNAIIYAAGDRKIKAVALLSPGLNYFSVLPTEGPVKAYAPRPLLAVASSEDLRSVEAVKAYAQLDSGTSTRLFDNAGHGTDILQADVGLEKLILDFLAENL